MVNYIRLFHVIFVFMWIGNLLALTRLMGYHTTLDGQVQLQMAKIYRRMNNFIGLPSMIVTIFLGIVLMMSVDLSQKMGWFVLKMHFVTGLVGCQLMTGYYLTEMQNHPIAGRGVKYKVLHGFTGIFLIGVLASIYLYMKNH